MSSELDPPEDLVRRRAAVRAGTPWIYSGIVHLLLILLLLDLVIGSRAPEPAREVTLGFITFAEGDSGDSGEAAEAAEEADAEADEVLTDAEATASAPAQQAPPPMAPQPDPVRREPSPPTDKELEMLFGVGGSPKPMLGPTDAASDPEARSLYQALLGANPERGVASPYGARNATGRQAGVKASGGTTGSESAVESGLAWLAAHQASDGSWRLDKFSERCPAGDLCAGAGYKSYDVGGTALATLAFLGAGYHHRGTGSEPGQPGFYANCLQRALANLLAQQMPDGSFGGRGVNMYNQAIVALALIESFALTSDPQLRRPIMNVVSFMVQAQEPKGGWNYSPHASAQRNDTSITGWVLMALHGAEVTGFKVPASTLTRARNFVDAMTAVDGHVAYADNGQLAFRDSLALVPVGLFSMMLLGGKGTDARSLAQVQLLGQNLPAWNKTSSIHTSLYYCYYGTLALYFRGGPEWERWNQALLAMLLPTQRQSGHQKGSWDPVAKWATQHGGRVYSTALSILNLEIYYKYRPSYLSPRSIPGNGHFGFGARPPAYPSAELPAPAYPLPGPGRQR